MIPKNYSRWTPHSLGCSFLRQSSAPPTENHFHKSFPCHSYKLFHSPYPATPLFATLTKTAGVCTNNSHSGTPCHHPGLTHVVSYSYKLFCTCRKHNSSIFKQLQTLLPKHPGWGIPSTGALVCSNPQFPAFHLRHITGVLKSS